MSEKKQIDKLFKERLKDFEVAPGDHVWDRIEDELHKDKRKRRVIPIWWKVVGVAAVLALLFTVGKTFFNSSEVNAIETEVVDSENSDNPTEDSIQKIPEITCRVDMKSNKCMDYGSLGNKKMLDGSKIVVLTSPYYKPIYLTL